MVEAIEIIQTEAERKADRTCPRCGHEFDQPKSLRAHLARGNCLEKPANPGNVNRTCSKCGRILGSAHKRAAHEMRCDADLINRSNPEREQSRGRGRSATPIFEGGYAVKPFKIAGRLHGLRTPVEKMAEGARALDAGAIDEPVDRFKPHTPIEEELVDLLKEGPITRDQMVRRLRKPRTTIYDGLKRLIVRNEAKKFPLVLGGRARGRPKVLFALAEFEENTGGR